MYTLVFLEHCCFCSGPVASVASVLRLCHRPAALRTSLLPDPFSVLAIIKHPMRPSQLRCGSSSLAAVMLSSGAGEQSQGRAHAVLVLQHMLCSCSSTCCVHAPAHAVLMLQQCYVHVLALSHTPSPFQTFRLETLCCFLLGPCFRSHDLF